MRVFLSYAQADEAFARSLSEQLTKLGLSVWSSHVEVFPGDNAWLRIGQALKKSNAMVVLVSPDSMRSENVRREIEYALGDPNYEGRLFPVQVRPTPNLPWILRKLKTFDTRRNVAKVSESIVDALKQVA
jgi:TIR domain